VPLRSVAGFGYGGGSVTPTAPSAFAVTDTPVANFADQRGYRLSAIDLVRGLVVVIMAIDHVRDFTMVGTEQDPMANPNITIALFLTRWITHFCAPVFVLLAGTSAGLMTGRRSRHALAQFLVIRGVWLILIEVLVLSNLATFSPSGIPEMGGSILVAMQVIWAIAASMLALSALQYLGRRACLLVGIIIVAGHNLLDPFWPANALFEQRPLWIALHAQMSFHAGPFQFLFIYPVLAWIGVMLVGFGASEMFELPAPRRNAVLLRTGAALTAAFVLLRAADMYGDPNPWQLQPDGATATVIDFLNTTKYPPSLLFLLMTLGPAVVLCALADRWTGVVKNALVTFGRVPFAFYVPHFLLIHLIAVLVGVAQGFNARQFFTVFFFFPKGYGVGLPGVYALWAVVVVILYPLCRWVASVKARRRDWWLSYV
jgi:uncharacterized membrane protein